MASSESTTPAISPQKRVACCCLSWSTAKECIRERYPESRRTDLAADPYDEERCECLCHDEQGGD